MKQFGLTVIALVLVVTTALPANALIKKPTISAATTFTMASIPGAWSCC